jgi:hypothetical protein
MPNFFVFQGTDTTGTVAIIVAAFTFVWNEVRYRRQHRAEKAVARLLTARDWRLRTFVAIKQKVGGYDKDEDELRRLLGAIRGNTILSQGGQRGTVGASQQEQA